MIVFYCPSDLFPVHVGCVCVCEGGLGELLRQSGQMLNVVDEWYYVDMEFCFYWPLVVRVFAEP